jgi:hypothetical protein
MTTLIHLASTIPQSRLAGRRAALRTAPIIETKRIDGKPAHRVEGSPEGAWRIAESDIDAILDRVMLELGVSITYLLAAIDVDSASISRCRHGTLPLQDKWLTRLHLLSGIPVAELIRVACYEHPVFPHAKARVAS